MKGNDRTRALRTQFISSKSVKFVNELTFRFLANIAVIVSLFIFCVIKFLKNFIDRPPQVILAI